MWLKRNAPHLIGATAGLLVSALLIADELHDPHQDPVSVAQDCVNGGGTPISVNGRLFCLRPQEATS